MKGTSTKVGGMSLNLVFLLGWSNLTRKDNKAFSTIEKRRREKFKNRIVSEGYIDYREGPDFFREERGKEKNN